MASSLRQRKTFDDAAGPLKGSRSVKSGCRLCRLLGAAVFNIRLHLVYQARSRGMSARMQTFARACFGVFPSSASASKGWQHPGRRRGALLCEDARPGPRNPASARVFPRFSLPGWFSGAANSLSFQAHSNFFDASAPCAYPRLPPEAARRNSPRFPRLEHHGPHRRPQPTAAPPSGRKPFDSNL